MPDDCSLEVRLLHADTFAETAVAATFGDAAAKAMLTVMNRAVSDIRDGAKVACAGCKQPLHTLLSREGAAPFSAACAAPPGWADQSRAIVLFMCADCAPTVRELRRQVTIALQARPQ
jgi:hypothetical protein